VRFLIDASGGLALTRWLREHDHDVRSVEEESPRADDRDILLDAVVDDRILITNDKDFGTLVYAEGMTHRGVILLRLTDERAASKIAVVADVIARFGDRLDGQFVVVTEIAIRFSRGSS
jgi:predicted nuclease of predicted toxin-antitoxin system